MWCAGYSYSERTHKNRRSYVNSLQPRERASERAPLTEQSRAGGGFGPTQPLFIAPPPPPSVRAAIDCRVLNIKRRFIKIESLKPSTSYACNSSRSIPKMPSPQAASAVTASGKCRHRKRQLVQTIASAAWLDYSCLMRTRLVHVSVWYLDGRLVFTA